MTQAEVALEFVVFGYASPDEELLAAGFPPEYIDGVRPRLAAYRRLARIDSLERLRDFRAELADRYGKLPPPAETLLKVAEIRIIISVAGYESMTVAEGRAVIRRGSSVYREPDGRIPSVDPRNPAFLRLALARKIAQDAAASRAGQN